MPARLILLISCFALVSFFSDGTFAATPAPPAIRCAQYFKDLGARTPELNKYATNLVVDAFEGRIDPVIGRESEIEDVVQILKRRNKANPLLLGKPGVGKTAAVGGLALLIASGKAPKHLAGKRIMVLDMALLVAGTKNRGEFEGRLKKILAELKAEMDAGNDNTILFIDEIHTVVGAGKADGGMDASNILKPALARWLKVIGATTFDEYKKYIEPDPALERRFQPVDMEAPNDKQTVEILMGLREKYEKHHGVVYTDDALRVMADLAGRYIQKGRQQPDKSIDVMDIAAARASLRAEANGVVDDPRVPLLKQMKEDLEKFAKAQKFEEAGALQKKIAELEKKMAAPKFIDGKPVVDVETVREVISKISGVDVKEVDVDQAAKLLGMEAALNKRVLGQGPAIKAITEAIQLNKTGLSDPNRPIGSFIFAGETGGGKTLLAKELAAYMFGTEEALVVLDMSEYSEKQNVSRLNGASPGYVGYEDGGQLTERIKRKPYCVLLLDEAEKAHPDVWNMMLQVLEEGRMTDAKGNVISFKNVIVIMTTNLGSKEVDQTRKAIAQMDDVVTEAPEASGGFRIGPAPVVEAKPEGPVAAPVKPVLDYPMTVTIVNEALGRYFRPEFLNRVDEKVVFQKLNRTQLMDVAKIEVAKVSRRLEAEQKLKITISDGAREYLVDTANTAAFGGRAIRDNTRAKVSVPLSKLILRGQFVGATGVNITVEGTGDSRTLLFEPTGSR